MRLNVQKTDHRIRTELFADILNRMSLVRPELYFFWSNSRESYIHKWFYDRPYL